MGELMAYKHRGFWQCMDTKRDHELLEKLWADNKAPWRPQEDQMKFLITGGFGYVGGRLAKHLASSGHEVFLGSRTIKAKPSWLTKGSVIVMDWGDEGSC